MGGGSVMGAFSRQWISLSHFLNTGKFFETFGMKVYFPQLSFFLFAQVRICELIRTGNMFQIIVE